MSFKDYILDKIVYIIFYCIFIFFLTIMLNSLSLNKEGIVFLDLIILIFNLIMLLYEYKVKSEYYNELKSNLDSLDKKYLISQIQECPNFYDGQLFYDVIQQTDKSMNDEIFNYKNSIKEYKEFLEMWVHEIKTPIASSKLIIENNKNEITQNIDEELDKIDNLVEQVLFYAKSNEVQKDYIISKIRLKNIITTYLKANYKLFLNYDVAVNIDNLDNDVTVYTDKKWIIFIISQIISNSIKYGAKIIKIYSKEDKTNCSLYIQDNGIGIPSEDLIRVFDKGFTGINGRKYSKSTGIGLYLCKKLCNKLDIGIDVSSKQGYGTMLKIVFPKFNIYEIN